MIAFVLAALAALIGIRAHRVAPDVPPESLARARARFAVALLALSALATLAASPRAGAFRPLAIALAVIAAFVAWEAMARLVAAGTRGRDVAPRIAMLGGGALALASGAPWLLAAMLAGQGTIAYRWKQALPTRRLLPAGVAALALAFAGFVRAADPEGLAGLARPAWAFASAVRWVAAYHALIGGIVLLFAFIRDPSLGVRTVGRRLALSHLLVMMVPLAVLAVLWMSTTVLGVNRDRAGVAARAIAAEGAQMEEGVRAALVPPGDPRPRLRALAREYEGRAPGTLAWARGGGRLEPLTAGADSLAGAVTAWLDSLGALPASGIVRVGSALYMGAAVNVDGSGAALLAPAVSLVRGRVSQVAGTRVRLLGSTADLSSDAAHDRADSLAERVADSLAAGADTGRAGSDSSELERARRVTRRFGIPDSAVRPRGRRPHTSVSAGGQSFALDDENLTVATFLRQGHTVVPSIRFDGRRWSRVSVMLSVGIPPGEALGGLFRNSSADPLGYLATTLIVLLAVTLGLVAIGNGIMVTNMGRGVASAIGALHAAARRLQAGDLSHRVQVKGEDDLWAVGRALNEAAGGLERGHEAEKVRERMEGELALARRIQARLLPAAPPGVPGLEIEGLSESAREVGGDYFDHLDLGGGRVVLVIADVSGKGVGAALLMSAFRAALVSHDLAQARPEALAARLNEFLHRSVEPGKFVTAFLAFLDAATGALHYVNAGHNPPALLRADGSCRWLDEGGAILGILPASAYVSGSVTLEPGDLLALYTDGVTEGAAADGEQWGEARLEAALGELRARPCGEIAREIVGRVRAFEGETGPADDITVLLTRRA